MIWPGKRILAVKVMSNHFHGNTDLHAAAGIAYLPIDALELTRTRARQFWVHLTGKWL